jgi:Fe-S cluster biogenesis protein NfuA/nitrite reductase/ring-hydroxylating ferredoxin subunit
METVDRVQELVTRVEALDDVNARETAQELLDAVLELYGDGLERIVYALDEAGPAGAELKQALAADGVVSSLLLIHGLYPVPLEERVHEALERVRPYMESHGGGVELLGLDDDVARLRLHGSCDGCAASASTLELAIKQELESLAPDLVGIEVEGVVEPAQPTFSGKSLPVVTATAAAPAWTALDVESPTGDSATRATVDGTRLLLANVGGTLLAYRDVCAACRSPLVHGELEDGMLTCPSCSTRFALPLAGRVVGGNEPLQLTPVPLLVEDGSVKVALAG